MKCIRALVVAVAGISVAVSANEAKPFTTGEIRLLTVSGKQETELRYLLKDGRMRIDQPGEIVPAPPVNLLDLKTGTLRILHPHNGTWQEIPAAALRPAALVIPGLPVPPPGIGPRQDPGITPPGQPGRMPTDPEASSPGVATPPGIGPDLPGLPEMPRMPELPRRPELPPNFSPAGLSPPANGIERKAPEPSAIPPAGDFPPRFPGQAGPPELKPAGETREIHGYPCEKYTLSLPRDGEMILWLAGPGLLPPFHLLEDDAPHRDHRRDALGQVPALLRERNHFPLLAEMKGDDGHGIVRWEVTRITAGDGADDSLFEVPGSFHRLDPPEPARFDLAR